VLAVLECSCADDAQWSHRINGRKTLPLPPHHQTDWDTFQEYLHYYRSEANYPITHLRLIIDTLKPLEECIDEIVQWLEKIK